MNMPDEVESFSSLCMDGCVILSQLRNCYTNFDEVRNNGILSRLSTTGYVIERNIVEGFSLKKVIFYHFPYELLIRPIKKKCKI